MNWIGMVAAVTAFLGIWAGHVAVRKTEYTASSIRLPMLAAIIFGLVLLFLSLFTHYRLSSVVFGILGVIALWDAFELVRQQRRVRKGHAPANPDNPRHAAMLAAPGSQATTVDLLKREPLGRSVSADEALELAIES